ncbi:MAG: hypothetical protein A2033_15295, partial [Bacteroidetes bacterium GWA2_31_9]
MVTRDFELFFTTIAKCLIISSIIFQSNYVFSQNKASIELKNLYSEISELEKTGNFSSVIKLFDKFENSNDYNEIEVAEKIRFNYNYGIVLKNSYQFNNAIKYFKKALSYNVRNTDLSDIYINMAYCYLFLNESNEIENHINNALNCCNSNDDYFITNIKIAYFYSAHIKDVLKSQHYLDNAIIYFQKLQSNNSQSAYYLNYLGNAMLYSKNYNKALEHFQYAIINSTANFTDTNRYNNPDLNKLKINSELYLLYALELKAFTFKEKYAEESNNINDLMYSYKTYLLTIELLEKMQTSYINSGSRLFYSGDKRNIYNYTIKVVLKLYELTKVEEYKNKAFEISEKAKSAVLQMEIKDLQSIRYSGVPDNIVKEERKLASKSAELRQSIYDERQSITHDSVQIKKLEQEEFLVSQSYDSLIHNIEHVYPDYYKQKYSHQVISIQEIQQKLTSDEALLEYAIRDSMLVIFCVTSKNFEVKQFQIDSNFFNQIRNYSKLTSEFSSDYESYVQLLKSGYYLYNKLIFTVKKWINNKRLIIIPDYQISKMSFDALVCSDSVPEFSDYSNVDYLIKNHAISYGLSANLIFKEKKTESFASKILAVAPSYENIKNISDLPLIKSEAKEVCLLFDGKHLLDSMASEQNFKSIYSNFDFIHFSAHSFANAKEPLFSGIYLSSSNDTTEDGILYANEIYNMDFSGKTIIMSSCNSGDGLLAKGEGILSLARALTFSGSSSIILTLWQVADKAGFKLMKSFYTNLYTGDSKDFALQKSK